MSAAVVMSFAGQATGQTNNPNKPTWWAKYEYLAAYGGVSHPFWTDSRNQFDPFAGCRTGLAMEEVFTAIVTNRR